MINFITTPMIPGLIITGFFFGLLSGLFGMGGLFLTPLLRIFFNVPYHICVGTSLTAILPTSLYGSYQHYMRKHVNLPSGLVILGGTFPGIWIGVKFLTFLKTGNAVAVNGVSISLIDIVLNSFYILLLVSSAVIMISEYVKCKNENKALTDLGKYNLCITSRRGSRNGHEHRINFLPLLGTGFLVGILQGLLGVGGGFLLIPVLIRFYRIPAPVVIGTTLFIVSIASIFGSASHIFEGNVDLRLAGLLLLGSLPGSFIGTGLTHKFRGQKIRLYTIILLFVATGLMTWKFISQLF